MFHSSKTLSALLLSLLAVACHPTRPREHTVVMAWESFPLSLDPRLGQDQASQRLLSLTHQGLLRRNEHLDLVPDACLDWRWERPFTDLAFDFPDGKEARRLGRTWFWFGPERPLAAADALDAIEALRDPTFSSPKAGPFKEEIASVSIEDLKTIQRLHIHLRAPSPGFPSNLGRGSLGIAPVGSRAPLPLGTGPYRVLEVIPEQRILLEAKRDHPDFAARRGQPQDLELRLLPDTNTRLLALRHGTVQAALNNLPADLMKPGQGFEIRHSPGANLDYVVFQCEQGPTSDPRVRLALALALDRRALMGGLMGGMAREAWGFYPPELPQGIDVRQSLSISSDMTQRLHRAEALLDEAGYSKGPKGIRLTLRLSTSPDVGVRLRALALQSQWRRIGVDLRILGREFGTLFSEISAGKFEMAMLRWTGASDPEMLVRVFHSSMVPPAGFNRGRFRDAEVDSLLEASRLATTQEARLTKLRQAQIRIVEAAPYVFLWWPDQVIAIAPDLDIDLNGVGDFTGFWRKEKIHHGGTEITEKFTEKSTEKDKGKSATTLHAFFTSSRWIP